MKVPLEIPDCAVLRGEKFEWVEVDLTLRMGGKVDD